MFAYRKLSPLYSFFRFQPLNLLVYAAYHEFDCCTVLYFYIYIICVYGGFLKWWYPTTMGFLTTNYHFGMFWGYHHLRKQPYRYLYHVFPQSCRSWLCVTEIFLEVLNFHLWILVVDLVPNTRSSGATTRLQT